MKQWVKYPWSKLEAGQGFFVPCLDVAKISEEGLREAKKIRRRRFQATPGIHNGRLGVWFSRRY